MAANFLSFLKSWAGFNCVFQFVGLKAKKAVRLGLVKGQI